MDGALSPGVIQMKRRLFALAVLGLGCSPALAETQYFVWTDADGNERVTAEQPNIGVHYRMIAGPDPVHWYNPPEMPRELKRTAEVSPQKLFQSASASVYTIVGKDPANLERAKYGSAVAITDKLAITNCHIILDAADEIYLGGGADEGVEQAKLVGADYVADRCVVSVSRMDLHPVAGIRSYDGVKVGEAVYAIGNPSMLERTLSEGILSGKRVARAKRLLQTTAAISPGSSGGGLFDAEGNLLGVTSFTLKGSQSLNFAIPAEDYWK
jgi:S1-C subfamily serine protease